MSGLQGDIQVTLNNDNARQPRLGACGASLSLPGK